MSWSHNIAKCGSTILSAAGRFIQIWNSSSGFGSSDSTSGNISACTMPLPAVIHCTSPRPYRAAAPSESEWSTRPRRTNVIVSNPRCGCCGKPGTSVPWYIRHPSMPSKSWPSWRPASDVAGPRRVVAGRVVVDVVDAEQVRIDGLPLESERDRLDHRRAHGSRLQATATAAEPPRRTRNLRRRRRAAPPSGAR